MLEVQNRINENERDFFSCMVQPLYQPYRI